MRHVRTRRRWALVAVTALAAVIVGTGSPAADAAAPAHAKIDGSGSSWAQNAVNQWIADVYAQGLQVVFTPTGSAQGRKDYAFRNVDFAVSDIAYQGKDPLTGDIDTAGDRPYVYLPIVAGGTSFPYQIKVGGKLVRNLRLSGQTLAEIFTNQITNWNDPAITKDNNGHALPSLPIIPVVHSEGSGSTAQFTAYLAKIYPDIWKAYNGGHDVMTEYYPRKGSQVSQNGSDGVMNFITSSAANGAIGFDEYSYALNADYPVAKVENSAGYFTLPNQYNVAESLTQAQLDNNPNSPTYLIEDLSKVYTYSDPRTYPLSSYSYFILPTGTNAQDPRLTTAKRQTIVDFLYYSICTGQRQMGPLGYSPLPVNLVQDGFGQINKLQTADSNVDITKRDVSTCNNPTFVAGHPDQNYLAQIAPQPLACDKAGAGPCSANTPEPQPTTGSGGGTGGTGGGGTGGTGGATAAPSASSAVRIDPNTGEVIAAGPGTATGPTTVNAADLNPVPNDIGEHVDTSLLTPLLILELLAVLVVPVILGRILSARKGP